MGIRNSPSRYPLPIFFTLMCRCWLGCSSSRPHSSRSLILERERERESELHIDVLEIKVLQLTLNAFLPRVLEEWVILMSNNATLVAI